MDQEGLVPIKAPRKSLLRLKRLISREEPKDCEKYCADNSVFVEMDDLRDLQDLQSSKDSQDQQNIILRDDLEKPKNRASSIYGSIKDFISILTNEQKPNFTSPTRIKLTPSQMLTLVEAQERLKAYKNYCEGHKREDLKYRTLNKIPENLEVTVNLQKVGENDVEAPILKNDELIHDAVKEGLVIANYAALEDIAETEDSENTDLHDNLIDEAIDSCIDDIVNELNNLPKTLDEPITSQHTDKTVFFVDQQKTNSLDDDTENMIEKRFATSATHLEWMNGVCANLDAPLDRYTISLRESLLLKDFSQMPQ